MRRNISVTVLPSVPRSQALTVYSRPFTNFTDCTNWIAPLCTFAMSSRSDCKPPCGFTGSNA